MKLFIFGNTCSGKTTLIEKLNRILKFEYLSIDDYRKKYGDFTFEYEAVAVKSFVDGIAMSRKNQIIECSGKGKVSNLISQKLSLIQDTKKIIFLDTHWRICIKRSETKPWFELKLPFDFENKIQDRIREYNIQDLVREKYFRSSFQILSNENFEEQESNIEYIKNLL